MELLSNSLEKQAPTVNWLDKSEVDLWKGLLEYRELVWRKKSTRALVLALELALASCLREKLNQNSARLVEPSYFLPFAHSLL